MIIIALLILIMVGIVLYAARSATTKRGEERVETQQRTAALLQPVQDYVTQCLDLMARAAIEQLGSQGGVLYTTQGGMIPEPGLTELGIRYVTVEGAKVAYAIQPPQGAVGAVFFSQLPEYPWATFPSIYDDNGTLLLAEYLQGYYGINKLPQLQRPDPGSVQEQLETVVLGRTRSCIDVSVLEQQGIRIVEGTPFLRVVFGERGTSFLLTYPLEVTSTVSGTSADIDAFAVELPVRLRTLMDVAHTVVDKDVTDISFDTSSLVLKDIAISTQRDVYQSDDLLVFNDPYSSLGGRPFVFRAARKNRAPALVWIPNVTVDAALLCDGSTITASAATLTGDAGSCNGDGFKGFSYAIKAYDPDEDVVAFAYTAGPSKQQVPPAYAVTSNDAGFTRVAVQISASDRQFTDMQEILVPIDFNPPS